MGSHRCRVVTCAGRSSGNTSSATTTDGRGCTTVRTMRRMRHRASRRWLTTHHDRSKASQQTRKRTLQLQRPPWRARSIVCDSRVTAKATGATALMAASGAAGSSARRRVTSTCWLLRGSTCGVSHHACHSGTRGAVRHCRRCVMGASRAAAGATAMGGCMVVDDPIQQRQQRRHTACETCSHTLALTKQS